MFKVDLNTVPGHVAVLTLYGRLLAGETCVFGDAVQGLIGNDCRQIVIDLRQLDTIDCAGLGELIRSFTEACDAGVQLTLFNPTQRVAELLRITKLISVFPIVTAEHFQKPLQSSFVGSTVPEDLSESLDTTMQSYAAGAN